MPPFGESREAQDIRRLGPEQVDVEQRKWSEMQQSVERLRDHPLMPQLERVAVQAQSVLQRIVMMENMPGSEAMVSRGWQELGQMYNEAVRIRASMLGDGVRVSMGIEPGVPLQDGMVQRLRAAFQADGNQAMRSVVEMLEPFARGLGVNPNDVQANRVMPGNIFYLRDAEGVLRINHRSVTQAYEALTQVSASVVSQLNPQQQEVLEGMRRSLAQLEQVDPVRSDLAARYRLANSHQTDMRPLRMVAAVGATFISGLGLAMGLKSGNITWPTWLWGGIAALSINPDLLKGQGFQTMKGLAFMGQNDAQMVLRQIDPVYGPLAIAEAVALRTRKPDVYAQLTRSQTGVTRVQLERLVGSSDSPLLRVMDKVPDVDRGTVLNVLAKPSSRDEMQIMQRYVQNRNQVQPTFTPDARASMGATPMGLVAANRSFGPMGQMPPQFPGQVPPQMRPPMPGQMPFQMPGQIPGRMPPQIPGRMPAYAPGAPFPVQAQPPRFPQYGPSPSHWMITGNGAMMPAPGSLPAWPNPQIAMPGQSPRYNMMPPVLELGPYVRQDQVRPIYGPVPNTPPQAWQLINTPRQPTPDGPIQVMSMPEAGPFRFENPNLALNRLIGPKPPPQPRRIPLGPNLFYTGPVYYSWQGRPTFLPQQPIRNYPPNRGFHALVAGKYPFPGIYPPGGLPPMGPPPPAPGWPPHN